MNKYINKYLIIMLMFPVLAGAQTVQIKKKTAVKSTNKVTKMTLGDLLKRAARESRSSMAPEVEKKSIVVPDSKMIFEEKKMVDLSEIKPPRLAEIYNYENRNEAVYAKTLNLQIDELYKLTQKFKESTNRGELWLRLAELYVEKANIVDKHIQDEYDKRLKVFLAGKTKVKPVLQLAEAREYNKKAIQLYEWFLRDFPKDPKVSQALFFLGYNNFEIGNSKEGTAYYDQLTTRFPTSQFSGEAHFAIGEGYFEKEKWADAYKEYAFLIRNNKHNLHIIALYKSAWCLFRLGKTEEGIKYLDYIVRSSRYAKQQKSASGKKINVARLENESIRDLVVFFADTGDTQRAITYFTNLNTKEGKESIEKLAYYFSGKGNNVAAREVFRHLILQEPTSKKSFDYQYQIVQNYFFSKNFSEFKLELYRWIVDYNAKSVWYNSNKDDLALIQKSNQLKEQTLRSYILQQHQAAQNSRAEFSRQAAIDGYRLYFQEFSDAPLVGDMHFFCGELLYDMAQYADAATEYTAVVDGSPNNQYAERAAQNILLAIEKTLPSEEVLQKRLGDSVEPIALDENLNKFVTRADWYLKKYPKAERGAEIRFRVGRIHYLSNNFSSAEQQFKDIVRLYPNTKLSEYSANLLLDVYSLKNDYEGLERTGLDLLSQESIAKSQIGADIRGVLEKASFKRGQSLETEKKYLESANQFQVFTTKYAKSDLVGIALFNAAVNFERAGKNKEAILNYNRMLALNSPTTVNLAPKVKRLLAKLYQDSGSFDESAKLYSQLVKENSKDPFYASYLYNKALMLEIMGKSSEAMEEYRNYLKVSKNQNELVTISFKIAEYQRQANLLDEALLSYKRFVQMPQASAEKKIEAHYWIYDLSIKRNDGPNAIATEQKIRGLSAALPDGKRQKANAYLAKIKLNGAKEIFNSLKIISIPANAARQKIAVDKKLELMNILNHQLGNIIKLDSAEEIVSALYILGESNEHMAKSFSSVPVPEKLNAEQRKLYLAEIEKITQPFVNKSDESYKLAIERGGDLHVYSLAYRNSLKKMNIKYPDKFYDLGEVASEIRSIDWAGDR